MSRDSCVPRSQILNGAQQTPGKIFGKAGNSGNTNRSAKFCSSRLFGHLCDSGHILS